MLIQANKYNLGSEPIPGSESGNPYAEKSGLPDFSGLMNVVLVGGLAFVAYWFFIRKRTPKSG